MPVCLDPEGIFYRKVSYKSFSSIILSTTDTPYVALGGWVCVMSGYGACGTVNYNVSKDTF